MGNAVHISFQSTGAFSALVEDYLSGNEELKPFYSFDPSLDGIKKSIEQREKVYVNRNVLHQYFVRQYENIESTKETQNSIESLLKPNVFTVCTAHQPNLFSGPLYFIYKIIHCIKLAEELNQQFSDKKFVPVYFMGSEDADLDELGFVNIDGKKYVWQTEQQGAVGRMIVDDSLIKLINEIEGRIGVEKFGEEWISILKKYYTKGKSIQQATFEFVHHLFGKKGLLVLIPDDSQLKKLFLPIAKNEIENQFSKQALEKTKSDFPKKYKIQVEGREINLFLLDGDKRNRIIEENGLLKIGEDGEPIKVSELLSMIESKPEMISPNVILRPVFQEMILPNIAFIGGGGELAYWLELKNVFQSANIPFPVLLMRNSFALLDEKTASKIHQLNLQSKDFFLAIEKIHSKYFSSSRNDLQNLDKQIEEINQAYLKINSNAKSIDESLGRHTISLQAKSMKKLEQLKTKYIRRFKQQDETAVEQINKIKKVFYPAGLQERSENIALFYSKYGEEIFEEIENSSQGIESCFTIITLKNG